MDYINGGRDLSQYAKNHWIPVEISLPDNWRLVQIQTEELPDPTIGSFYAKQGKWSFEERNFSEMNAPLTVIAWREMADPYEKNDDEKLIFRSACEVRVLSFNALRRIKNENLNQEFYDVREKALHATTQGLFEMYLENASDDILKGLNDAGYAIIKKEKGYLISWK